eukprot:TRINITY_DN9471_c0_g2_i1.p1 TRINITY_DN9471_c0_g2~~TRINITY_DN9471_c0_g2_i1.p1  ORF type:complete len:594 (+),score=146.49 TRINITY_DN9471_c0_g2_i1:105-1784(+)
MPLPPATRNAAPPRAPLGEAARAQKLTAERNDLLRRNKALAETVRSLEEAVNAKAPEDVRKLADANAQLTAQVAELLEQMVAAEERVISAEAACEEHRERAAVVSECRDRQVGELQATIDELREQHLELQGFNAGLRSERDTAARQTAELRAAAAAVDSAAGRAQEDAKREAAALQQDIATLTARTEELEAAAESERTAAAAALSEAHAATAAEQKHTEALAGEYVVLEGRLETAKKEAADEATAAEGLRRDLRERDVALRLMQEKLDVAQVECELLRRWKATRLQAAEAAEAAAARTAAAECTVEGGTPPCSAEASVIDGEGAHPYDPSILSPAPVPPMQRGASPSLSLPAAYGDVPSAADTSGIEALRHGDLLDDLSLMRVAEALEGGKANEAAAVSPRPAVPSPAVRPVAAGALAVPSTSPSPFLAASFRNVEAALARFGSLPRQGSVGSSHAPEPPPAASPRHASPTPGAASSFTRLDDEVRRITERWGLPADGTPRGGSAPAAAPPATRQSSLTQITRFAAVRPATPPAAARGSTLTYLRGRYLRGEEERDGVW